MRISSLFKQSSVDNAQRSENADSARREAKVASAREALERKSSQDTVTISSVSRQLSQVSRIIEEDEAQNQARVEDLKTRVAEGNYSVSSEEVAAALITNVAEG